VLIYCHRGGLDSVVWAEPLRAAGWSVDVLPGGWPNYRRWVTAGLEVLPRGLSFHVLRAPPLSGIERVLAALAFQGHQVLDLLALTGQRLMPGVLSRADHAVSQAAFESAVLHALRRYTPDREVWVNELAVHHEGSLALPSTLAQQLRQSPAVRVLVPLAQRSQAWHQNLNASNADLDQIVNALFALPAAPTKAMTARWRKTAALGSICPALSAIIEEFIDPRYDKLSAEDGAGSVECTLEIDSLVPLRGRAPPAVPELAAALATPSH
jgi:tRNA 2-selenouridine synthase